jgi:AcrR family transcriptional regulator
MSPGGKIRKPEAAAARQRIVEGAISCIEREGLHGVTIRGIAREAGVNSAAISYYFRSKEKLIDEALRTSLANSFGDWEQTLRGGTGELGETLRAVCLEILEGALRFPGMVRAHLSDSFAGGSLRAPFVRKFDSFLASMAQRLRRSFPDRTAKRIGAEVVQTVSAVFLPAIIPALFASMGIDLGKKSARERYVDLLVERLLEEKGRGPPAAH